MRSINLLVLACCLNVATHGQSYMGDEFALLKGKLAWPVENVKEVPKRRYPVNFHAYQPTPMLTIHSDSAFAVKALANGLVHCVFDIEGTWNVMLKHGNYFTVYSNLTSVSIKRGDTIQAQQSIGRVSTRLSDKELYELDLGIYNKSKALDPEPWLVPRIVL